MFSVIKLIAVVVPIVAPILRDGAYSGAKQSQPAESQTCPKKRSHIRYLRPFDAESRRLMPRKTPGNVNPRLAAGEVTVRTHPPAIAPRIISGSAPDATATGSNESGGS